MPREGMSDETDDGRESKGFSRRKMLALTSGAAAGGLAGCGGDGGGESPTDDGATPTPRRETVIVTQDGETVVETRTVKVTEEETPTPEPELMEPTVDVTHGTLPADMSFNGFHPDGDTTMTNRLNTFTGIPYFDGTVENLLWESREWDSENKVWTLNFKEDHVTWWNGTTYDAEDWWIGQIVNHILFGDGSYWAKAPELVDKYTVKCYPPIKRAEILMATRYCNATRQTKEEWMPFLESLRDASTQEEVDQIYNNDVKKYERGFDTIVENGYGTGSYYPVTYNEQEVVMRRRDLVDDVPDHPFNEQQNIPEWKVHIVGGQSARDQMIRNDQVDMGGGALPRRFEQITPRYIQTLDVVSKPFGHNLQFNFKNEHLANKWVRRAVYAALDKQAMMDNAGVNGNIVQTDSGMPAFLEPNFLGEDFASQLHNYPDAANQEKVDEWMKKAGYTKNSNGKWEDSDGKVPNFTIKGTGGWAVRQQTLLSQLKQAGFKGEVQSFGWGTFEQEVREQYDYDMATFQWGCWGQIPHPWCFYRGDKHLNMNYGYKPAELDNLLEEGRTTSDLNEKPLVAEVPNTVGALEGSGTEVNMVDVGRNLEGGVNTQENARLGARFVNFYVDHIPLWTSTGGAWGDTENFNWPERGNKRFKTPSAHRQLMKQGILQGNYKG